MKLTLKLMSGDAAELDLDPDVTLDGLKSMVAELYGYEKHDQVYVIGAKKIEDDEKSSARSLKEFGVEEGSTLDLTYRDVKASLLEVVKPLAAEFYTTKGEFAGTYKVSSDSILA